jgi:mannose-6-phosphate isomerase-like protein (cupin superfamily)
MSEPMETPAAPQRIVTVNRDGRSAVLETGDGLTPFRWGSVVWPLRPEDPNRTALAPGEVSWRLYTLPSSEELDAYVAERYGEHGDARAGMHTTQTIDFVQVLEGRVALVLDEGTVELGPGDCVVQQATPHAWRVLQAPVRLNTLMIGVEPD